MSSMVARAPKVATNRLLLGAAAVLVVGAWLANWLIDRFSPPPLMASDISTSIDPSFLPVDEVVRLIVAYEERTTEVSTPSDFLNLGQLYLEHARLTSDPARYLQARAAFEQAAQLDPQDPTPVVGLARTELALHEFADAAAGARDVLADLPARLDALAVLADAEMAMGDVTEAARLIDILVRDVGEISPVLVRQAQLAWLEGDLDSAADLAVSAIPSSETNPRRLAFYEAYAASSLFKQGELEEASELAASSLGHDPSSIAALAISARVATAQGEFDRAIELLEQAVAVVPEPELNGELGDLYVEVGNDGAAREQFELVDVFGRLAASQAVFNRQVARFYADHDLDAERAFELAEAEIAIRQDPLGYDTLAWALYRLDRHEEARAAMDRALAGGFRDAETFYHDGLIALELGDESRARSSFERALELNPYFDLRGAADASRLLGGLS
jgi:tetratricopeptide (TPR) repeat protein